MCSCWKVSTPLKLTAFVPQKVFKIILLSHSCVQLILPHCECFSLKLGLQTSVMQRRIWQGDSKLPPLWKGTACFGAKSKKGTFARICLESCTWILLDPPQTLVTPHDVSSNRPIIFFNKCIARSNGKMSKLHDWPHFQNIAKGTTDPRVEFCLSK